jgi:GNAT superfamily N-acetyltransferase
VPVSVTPQLSIRAAAPEDAGDLVGLCSQLGHAVALGDVQSHLARPPQSGHCLLVAVLAGRVVGWLEAEARVALPTGTWAEVTGLVVEEGLRGQGVGSALVRSVRLWAQGQGLTRLRVRTRVERAKAARFYEKEGFQLQKQQRVYETEL